MWRRRIRWRSCGFWRRRTRRGNRACPCDCDIKYWQDGRMRSVMRRVFVIVLLATFISASAAPATKPAVDEVRFPPHPRLMLPDSELAGVQKRIKDHDWARVAFEDL